METKNIEVKNKPNSFEIFKDGFLDYRLIKELTSPMNQDKLAEYYEEAKKEGNPLPLNSIQTWEVIEDAVKSGNAELMNYIRSSLRNNWINTLSKAIYSPFDSENGAIHNYGTSDQFFLAGNIVGKDGWIKNIDNPNALEFLIGTKDIPRLNETSQGINGTPMYLFRVNSKPSQEIESFVWFDAGGVRLYLSANWGPLYGLPAFLVEWKK